MNYMKKMLILGFIVFGLMSSTNAVFQWMITDSWGMGNPCWEDPTVYHFSTDVSSLTNIPNDTFVVSVINGGQSKMLGVFTANESKLTVPIQGTEFTSRPAYLQATSQTTGQTKNSTINYRSWITTLSDTASLQGPTMRYILFNDTADTVVGPLKAYNSNSPLNAPIVKNVPYGNISFTINNHTYNSNIVDGYALVDLRNETTGNKVKLNYRCDDMNQFLSLIVEFTLLRNNPDDINTVFNNTTVKPGNDTNNSNTTVDPNTNNTNTTVDPNTNNTNTTVDPNTNDTNSILDNTNSIIKPLEDALTDISESLPVTGTDAMLFGLLACIISILIIKRN
ncbi:MAG: hypothetical protein CfClM3_1754 [Methanobrevibacter sp. CfCl-M3]